MSYFMEMINFIIHIDSYLKSFVLHYGFFTYFILFFVIFCETGIVIFPFLPGDSLLFAAGSLAAIGSLNIFVLILILCIGAVLGDTVNYNIGRNFGDTIIKKKIIKQAYLDETYSFFEKHGGKTIAYARFVPIVRTVAPFVAGIGKMNYRYFLKFNLISGIVWAVFFLLAGFFFGNIPFVEKNFSVVILGIILVSVMPPVISSLYKKLKKQEAK